MSSVILDDVSKTFPPDVRAVDHVNLAIDDGEFAVLVGPSGCGKSTILRMVAGLEPVTSGRIVVGDRDITDLPPGDRDVAMVFQNYALYPHLTVAGNMGFGLRMRHTPKRQIAAKVEEIADTLGLTELLGRKPSALSGGQRQRVAMGRALVREPQALLLDEPLSNLDAQLRGEMRNYLARLQNQLGTTTIFVTHDQVEAMTLGHRVAVLRDGRLQQLGEPSELFHRPVSAFVGRFIGTPSMNIVKGYKDDGMLRAPELRLSWPVADLPVRQITHRVLAVGIRPSDFEVVPRGARGATEAAVRVEAYEDYGDEQFLSFTGQPDRFAAGSSADSDVSGARNLLENAATDSGISNSYVARVTAGVRIRVGDSVWLRVDPQRLHLFDVETDMRLQELTDSQSAIGRSAPQPDHVASSLYADKSGRRRAD